MRTERKISKTSINIVKLLNANTSTTSTKKKEKNLIRERCAYMLFSFFLK